MADLATIEFVVKLRLMGSFRAAMLACGALALGGCTFPVGGLSVERAGLSQGRPPGTIGPGESDGKPPWQTYAVEVPSQLARAVVGMDSTFHLRVTDCRRKHVGRIDNGRIDIDGLVAIEDVYVDGEALNGGHSRLHGVRGSVVRGLAYVSTSRIGDIPELCFQASGGSMLGVGFRSNVVRVRR